MPEPDAAAAAEPARGGFVGQAARSMAIYFLVTQVAHRFMPTTNVFQKESGTGGTAGAVAVRRAAPATLANAWTAGTPLELRVYVSEARDLAEARAFDLSEASRESLVWSVRGLAYSSKSEQHAVNVSISPSARLLRNETAIFAHVYVSRAGFFSADGAHPAYAGGADLGTVLDTRHPAAQADVAHLVS